MEFQATVFMESGSMDAAAVASGRKHLAEFLAQYSPDDILQLQ